MIDLHTHLLPAIDDGPDTIEQALQLCRIALASGTTHAIVTPHIHPGRWENSRESIERRCGALARELEKREIPLQLGFAGEVRLTDEIPGQVERNDIPFYGEVDGFRIMLLEFPHGNITLGSDKLVQWLLSEGIRPMIAHPERNRQVMRDPSLLQPFIDKGCWLQVTAGSVVGAFGERAAVVAQQLLEADAVTVVASDGHNSSARPPVLREAFTHICNAYGDERAIRLMQTTPSRIVADQFPV